MFSSKLPTGITHLKPNVVGTYFLGPPRKIGILKGRYPKVGRDVVICCFVEITLPEPLTFFATENRPNPKRKFIFQPSVFRGCDIFREGI